MIEKNRAHAIYNFDLCLYNFTYSHQIVFAF